MWRWTGMPCVVWGVLIRLYNRMRLGISLVPRPKKHEVGSVRVDMGNSSRERVISYIRGGASKYPEIVQYVLYDVRLNQIIAENFVKYEKPKIL